MGDMISFPSSFPEDVDVLSLSADDLHRLLEFLQKQVELLDLDEPTDMESEEYDQWAEAHEELEDRIYEILDRLDELK